MWTPARSLLVLLGLALLPVMAAAAQVSFYTNRAQFDAVFPGVAIEDFEEARLSQAIGDIVNAPLSSSSSNRVFHLDEILPGMLFQDNPGPSPIGALFVSRSGYQGLPSKALSANGYADSLDIFLAQPAVAMEMDLFVVDGVSLSLPYTLVVEVYGSSGLLGSQELPARAGGVPIFFGVAAPELITRINVNSLEAMAEFVDNLGFAGPDTNAPVLTPVGQNMIFSCTDTPLFIAPTVTDDRDPNPVITFTNVTTPGACADSYTITRTWVATDESGNVSAPVSQTITVTDSTPPILSGQGGNEIIFCPATPVFIAPTATDNCDPNPGVLYTEIVTPGISPTNYTIERVWAATDRCGNVSAQVSQTIVVQDVLCRS